MLRATSKKELARLIENNDTVCETIPTANVTKAAHLTYSALLVVTRQLKADVKKTSVKDFKVKPNQ